MKTNQRINQLMPLGIPKWIRVYDNQGETFDRYTVVFTKVKGYFYLGMSNNPFHPQGFAQHGEGKYGPIDKPTYSHLGKKIKFENLPEDCKILVIQDYKILWNI